MSRSGCFCQRAVFIAFGSLVLAFSGRMALAQSGGVVPAGENSGDAASSPANAPKDPHALPELQNPKREARTQACQRLKNRNDEHFQQLAQAVERGVAAASGVPKSRADLRAQQDESERNQTGGGQVAAACIQKCQEAIGISEYVIPTLLVEFTQVLNGQSFKIRRWAKPTDTLTANTKKGATVTFTEMTFMDSKGSDTSASAETFKDVVVEKIEQRFIWDRRYLNGLWGGENGKPYKFNTAILYMACLGHSSIEGLDKEAQRCVNELRQGARRCTDLYAPRDGRALGPM